MADDNLERITILLQAKDREFARAMDRNNKLIAKLTKDAEKGTTRMSRGVQKNLDAMRSAAGSFAVGFAGGIAGGIVTGAIYKLTTGLAQTVNGIASIGDEARRAGLGVEAFQEWKFVAEQNRIGIDQLVDGFKELSLRADELVQTGAGPAKEAFDRLGYTSADLAKKLKDPSALMLEIIGRMEGMDKAAQIRIADEVFGGSAGERFVELLAQGDEGLRRTIDRARELGLVLDEQVIAKAAALDQKFTEVGNRITAMFQGIVVSAAESIGLIDTIANTFGSEEFAKAVVGADSFEALRDNLIAISEQASQIDKVRGAFLGMDAEISGLVVEATMLAAALEKAGKIGAAEVLRGWVTGLEATRRAFAAGEISAEEFENRVGAARDNVSGLVADMGDVNGVSFSAVIARLGTLGTALQIATGLARALRSALPGAAPGMTTGTPLTAGDIQMPPTSSAPTSSPKPRAAPPGIGGIDWGYDPGSGKSKGGGGGGTDRFGDGIKDWRVEVEGMLAEAEALNDLALAYDEYGVSVDVARKKAELLQEAKEAGKEITPQLRAEIDQLAESYANAAVELERAKERHDEFKSAVEEAKGTLSSAFTGLVTGALSFRDAISNVIGKLAEMIAMKGFEQLWGAGLGSATGGILKMFGLYSSGGYTGAGARNQPAGIVHKGEVVFSQDDVARAGGVAAVEAMRRNGVSRAVPAARQAAASASGGGHISIGFDQSSGSLTATMYDVAGRVTGRAIQAYDRQLPDRMTQVNRNPRVR